MTRVNVTGTNPTTRGIELVGWFDPDRATEYTENTEWDGNNNVSVATGSQWRHEMLYLTAGGRWVLHTWSRWQGDTPKYEFVDDERARQWLLLNNHDQSADEIAPVETERGPGRPEVGARVDVRLGELLPAVDTYAASHGLSRATAIRKLVAAGLVGASR